MSGTEWVLFGLVIAILIVGGYVVRSGAPDQRTQWQMLAALAIALVVVAIVVVVR